MPRFPLRSAALFVLLCMAGVSLASAAPARSQDRAAGKTAGIAKLFRALPELWASLTSVFMQEGSSLDPDGRSSISASSDAGSSLDPDGKTLCSASPAAGSSLDPNGHQ